METVKHPHSALPRDVHQSLPMATLHLYWVILRQTSDTVNLLLWGLHPKFSAFTAFHTALLVWAYPVDFTGVIFLLLLVLVRPDRWASAQTIPKTRPTPGSRQHYNVALSFILEFDTKFLLSFYRALCQLPEIQCFRGNLKKKKKRMSLLCQLHFMVDFRKPRTLKKKWGVEQGVDLGKKGVFHGDFLSSVSKNLFNVGRWW
jgi:hypothetical protein